jgi:hypothetical protein
MSVNPDGGARPGRPPGRFESRLAFEMVSAGIGAIMAILVGVVFFPSQVGPLAIAAMGAVGSLVGGGLAVLTVALKQPVAGPPAASPMEAGLPPGPEA